MNDDRDLLSPLLKTWRHTPPEAPDFNRGVWGRVQTTQDSSLLRNVFSVLAFFPTERARVLMPIAASVALVLSLAAGSGAAFAYDSLTRDDRMAAAYARSIDPLQMMEPAPHNHS